MTPNRPGDRLLAPKLGQIRKILQEHREARSRDYGVRTIGIFGSCVRSEATKASDVDILVELDMGIGFFKFLELEERLSKWIGARVDLVSKGALLPRIGKRILNEMIVV